MVLEQVTFLEFTSKVCYLWGRREGGCRSLGKEEDPDNTGFGIYSRWATVVGWWRMECGGASVDLSGQLGIVSGVKAKGWRWPGLENKYYSVFYLFCEMIVGFVFPPCQVRVPNLVGKRPDSHTSISTFIPTWWLYVKWAKCPWNNIRNVLK